MILGGPACQRYYCDVCNLLVISYNIKNHYVSRTDWKKLERLSKGVSEDLVVAEMGEIDSHTRYMWSNKHSKSNLPSYLTHRKEKTVSRGPTDFFLGRRQSDNDEEEVEMDAQESREERNTEGIPSKGIWREEEIVVLERMIGVKGMWGGAGGDGDIVDGGQLGGGDRGG